MTFTTAISDKFRNLALHKAAISYPYFLVLFSRYLSEKGPMKYKIIGDLLQVSICCVDITIVAEDLTYYVNAMKSYSP